MAELESRMKKGVPDPKTTKAITYKVRSGDVLGIIAQRYGVKVSAIKQWNNLYSDRINIGQELVIYISKSKTTKDITYPIVESKKEVVETSPQPGKGTSQSYIVKTGDSLWLIARKFPGVSAENIMEWNGISDKISPGQKLKIYMPE
jgi:membrane-bound lytic murein transglycosylase D